MELLDFINSHENWEELLSAAPYCLKIMHEEPYTILKYQQFISDMSVAVCQQARGLIIRQNPRSNRYIIVSHAMDKFFNYGESNAAEIDWTTASVTEKVDGSLMKIAFDPIDQHWVISTNGTISAFSAYICDTGVTFGELFARILVGMQADLKTVYDMFPIFLEGLNREYCYYFEMVSPYNRIVCKYDYGIYYLGRRSMTTQKEDFSYAAFHENWHIKYPRRYALSSIDACVHAAQELGENAEGFVVADALGRRIKVKSPWYLAMHHMRGNGILSVKRIVEMWQADILDDYVGNFSEYKEFIDKVIKKIVYCGNLFDTHWEEASHFCGKRKELAMTFNEIFTPVVVSYIFARLDGKVQNGIEWLKKWPTRKLGDYIASQLDVTEYGMEDDN